MSAFSPAEIAACERLIQLALEEDLGKVGDVTCQALIPDTEKGRAVFVARSPGILAGVEAAARVMKAASAAMIVEPLLEDGSSLTKGSRIATVEGPICSILIGERTALNFLQHLSGVATVTRRFVDAVAGLPCQILDTRKTIPGWRLLEKYAVRCGDGHNHRMGLYDGVLIKDNHLAAMKRPSADVEAPSAVDVAIGLARAKYGQSVLIEIEVENLSQLDCALKGGQSGTQPDIVLLDNMTLSEIEEAVKVRDRLARQVLLEVSGGVTLESVRGIAETGVDRISVGALTHSAPALDIALDYLP